jgi:titin
MENLGNEAFGVFIYHEAQHNMIGGDSPGEGNLISGNRFGLVIAPRESGWNSVINNRIGLDAAGGILGNTENGIYMGAMRQTFGIGNGIPLLSELHKTSAHIKHYYTWIEGNTIAGHTYDGIHIDDSHGNFITRNSIYQNDLGIDLTGDANGGINPPTIVSTRLDGGVVINGSTCAGCTVEVFESSDNDGEGEAYVGVTVANGAGVFELMVTYLNYPFLTATATDYTLVPEFGIGTSEFSGVYTSTVLGYLYLPLIEND